MNSSKTMGYKIAKNVQQIQNEGNNPIIEISGFRINVDIFLHEANTEKMPAYLCETRNFAKRLLNSGLTKKCSLCI
jgi:hypothetical protein